MGAFTHVTGPRQVLTGRLSFRRRPRDRPGSRSRPWDRVRAASSTARTLIERNDGDGVTARCHGRAMTIGGTAAYEAETDLPGLVRDALALARSLDFEYSCLPSQGRLLQ